MIKSQMNSSQKRSPLLEAQRMSGKAGKKVTIREMVQALPLTSLIDAFSIIVIYLLIGTQSGGLETAVPSMELPSAYNSQSVTKVSAILRIQNNHFFLDDVPIKYKNLSQKLSELKKNSKNFELMVQADQELKYAEIDPLIKAGSLAGIEKLKFAVLPTK
jgi:biopolymer transport protein ExbD